LADTFTGSIRTQAHEKFWRKGNVGVCRDGPFFGVPPIISGMGQATNFKFDTYIHRVHPNKKPFKIWEKRERGRIQGLPKFFEYPLLSQDRVKLRTSNLAVVFTAFMRTKAPYKFGRKGSVGVSKECPIFSVPPIITGKGRATNFKFCTHILSIDRNKSPLQISEKVAVC